MSASWSSEGLSSGLVLFCILLVVPFSEAQGVWEHADWYGVGGVESRQFLHDPLDPEQESASWSFFLKPALYLSWWRNNSLLFVPYLRWDSHDEARTHVDVRELYWETYGRTWELRIGIGQVFWGVMESQHLVDIINQTDLVEDPDGEYKLGQPMVNFSLIRDWGTVDFFVLPGFRQRTFPGRVGRLRSSVPVDKALASFESSSEQAHVDYAVRWSHVLGNWDLGLYQFYGTSRDPRLLPAIDSAGRAVLAPRYELIYQTGVDVQVTLASLLWKLEGIYQIGQGDSLVAASGGFEYTMVGALGSGANVGVLGEYHFDSDGEGNTLRFEDDVFVGVRLVMNDVQSTELLFGAIVDRDSKGRLVTLEASRRIGDNWRLELEARWWSSFQPGDPQFNLRNDDYIQLGILRYF